MMNKVIKVLLLIALMLLMVKPATAQEKENYKYTVKTNPLTALGGPFWVVVVPVTGEYKIQFEMATGQKQSLQVGLSYIGPSLLLNLDEITGDAGDISGVNTSGFRTTGMYKFFISRDLIAPAGFYISPYFSYASAKIENRDDANDYVKGTKMNFAGVFGYQMITSGGFSMDIFIGLGLADKKWEYSDPVDQTFDLGNSKTSPNVPLGFSFGYAF